MTSGPEPTMEDRLRSHYRALREAEPADDPSPRRDPSRVLAVAAGLTILLALGGAYLAGRVPAGEPVRADVGAGGQEFLDDGVDGGSVEDDRIGTGDDEDRSEPTTPNSEVESSQPVGDTEGSDEAVGDQGLDGGSDGVGVGGVGADGSPISPTPGTELPPPGAERSMAYGAWAPGPHDTCSAEVHDRYWVYGPDGKVYPTSHPPVDPVTGCSFGHEHGRDPADSDLADIPFPFGYVNEQLVAAGSPPRPESHVGHKIEWYNDGGYAEAGSSVDQHDQICDVAYKVHLDTHSAAAFDNNEHEVFLYARCENGSALIYRAMHRFGNRGEFQLHCDQGAGPTVTVDRAAGSEAPDERGRIDGREVPASPCFEDRVLVSEGERSDWFPFNERWTLYQSVDSAAFGRFFIQLQFFVDLPARYWDGDGLANTVDLCYVTAERQVRDDEFCTRMRAANPGVQVTWDDPASPFDGSARSIFMGDLRLDNEGGQTDWYTDANGEIWSDQPFPGSIRQYVGTTPIRAAASYRPDPIRSIDFADDLGIHPPN